MGRIFPRSVQKEPDLPNPDLGLGTSRTYKFLFLKPPSVITRYKSLRKLTQRATGRVWQQQGTGYK